MVVGHLVEQLLLTPEICSSNPDIGKILCANCTIEKMKIKKKWLGMAHPLNNSEYFSLKGSYLKGFSSFLIFSQNQQKNEVDVFQWVVALRILDLAFLIGLRIDDVRVAPVGIGC